MKVRHLHSISFFERYAFIILGIFILSLGYYTFLMPINLVTGGVGGLSIVLSDLFSIQTSYIIFILNGFLLILALIFLGYKVFLRSIMGSMLFPFFVYLFETFIPVYDLQNDYIIMTVFGGAMIGIGFGLVMKYGGTSGGSDIPIMILHRIFKIRLSRSIYIVDGFILLVGITYFFEDYGLLLSCYALVAVYITGYASDKMVMGDATKKAAHIVTSNPDIVSSALLKSIDRGISKIDVIGGYTNESKHLLVMVVRKREYYTLINIVSSIDPDAFVYVMNASEIHGDFEEVDV